MRVEVNTSRTNCQWPRTDRWDNSECLWQVGNRGAFHGTNVELVLGISECDM